MHALKVPYDIDVEEGRNGTLFVRFPIRHGWYNALEERGLGGHGTQKNLLLTEPSFILGIHAALPYIVPDSESAPYPWMFGSSSSQDIAQALAAISLDGNRTEGCRARIWMGKNFEIGHTYEGTIVWVNLRHFVIGSIIEFKNSGKSLALDANFPACEPFNKEFRKRWQACIERLKAG